MKKFLARSVFDKFELVSGTLTTNISYQIDGSLHKNFYSTDERETLSGRDYALWGEIRPHIFEIIRGKNQPLDFQFVLKLSGENQHWLLEHGALLSFEEYLTGLYINIRFQNGKLFLVTGLSYKRFIADKNVEFLWDRTAQQFLSQQQIASVAEV